ncbi:hypothetical protein MCOR27_007455 [Pyricularia oryzae]|uniref:Uncharacterized protein n=1 Tax=Pyricularia grisea TaxID=148305 RepID=A0ABQ8N7F9_PYRGI|nr:hypothetical protein MCOR01_005255 [Pyricularia oryzae]KAI6291152.1 hypothetical protein MCOR33_010806 [Pyricularia grisea]KAH9427631.1 hypothetical protein MCOR02_011867 [Pyricularia oryzae]KAI6255243.1 hypothetical protein MCOR19_008271 [Pyricularia oryzae]KAI6266798.1 hypothetical protein MCOR26_010013 [Pyricularia oryzae]
MSCGGGGCGAQSLFPDPNNRGTTGGAYRVTDPRAAPAARRPTYFNPTLHRVSVVAQNPTAISLRELGVLAVVLLALYKGFPVAASADRLLRLEPVASVCPRAAAVPCAWRYLQLLFGLLAYRWAGAVVPWALVAAVAVFFGEEALGMLRGRGRR